jgi:hypothetical protein
MSGDHCADNLDDYVIQLMAFVANSPNAIYSCAKIAVFGGTSNSVLLRASPRPLDVLSLLLQVLANSCQALMLGLNIIFLSTGMDHHAFCCQSVRKKQLKEENRLY